MSEASEVGSVSLKQAASRRRWLLAGVAATAAFTGVGVAWGRMRREETAGLPDVQSTLWDLSLPTPDGKTLHLATLRGKPLLLNFWAPWCPPCVEELPLLSRFAQDTAARGWQVLGVAVDQLLPVQQFLVKTPLAFPVVLAGMPGLSLSKRLGNLAGGLPFTIVLNPGGDVVPRKMGRVSPDDLRAWAALT